MKNLMTLVAAMVILATLGAIILMIRDSRTVAVTDTYQLTTTNSSSANIQLSDELWDSDTTRVTLVSNTTTDVPIAGNYTSTTRNLAIVGLAENTTRTFEVEYYTAGLSDFPWADTGILFLPTLIVLGVILIIAAVVVTAWQSRSSF